jgi:hypothetical protein
MKLKHQFNNLDNGKTLKELGIKLDSQFFYNPVHPDGTGGYKIDFQKLASNLGYKYCYPCFTVAELFAMLPEGTMCCRRADNDWMAVCKLRDEKNTTLITHGQTQAEALAWLLINLLHDKHIIAEDCNNRLVKA